MFWVRFTQAKWTWGRTMWTTKNPSEGCLDPSSSRVQVRFVWLASEQRPGQNHRAEPSGPEQLPVGFESCVCGWTDWIRVVCESSSQTSHREKKATYTSTRAGLLCCNMDFFLVFLYFFLQSGRVLTSDCWSAEATVKAAFFPAKSLSKFKKSNL